ncbi:MAG: transglycosylase domain-containing protein [Rhodospirillales bacterium]
MSERNSGRRGWSWHRAFVGAVWIAVAAVLFWGISIEIEASPLQSRLFTKMAASFSYHVEAGSNPDVKYPETGPYDERLGYARLNDFTRHLTEAGYTIDQQARVSPELSAFIDEGGFAIFDEKPQSGLVLYDRRGEAIHLARHPEYVFQRFGDVPPLVVSTLLFIENRELLDTESPTQNPAVEWDRFTAAAANTVTQHFGASSHRFGGSTLATQIEKFRHSPEGRTGSVGDKLRQITSASLRAYRNGPDTRSARRRIVLDYINATPLAARPGFGEVIGLGDGLWAWYGVDPVEAQRALSAEGAGQTADPAVASLYKKVLSLLLGQRRPSYFLVQGRNELAALTDSHLRLLADAGLISGDFRDAALAAPLDFRRDPPQAADFSFVDRKAVNAMRTHVAQLLQVPLYYDLDRFDLSADTTLDAATERKVIETLRSLMDPKEAERAGLTGERLLSRGQPDGVVYSITLYERGEGVNYVRVQADNMERPLDLNEGGKFDLGSTAKLRTLVTYLQIVEELHDRLGDLDRADLQTLAAGTTDPMTRWAVKYLTETKDRSLAAMIDAAMQRKYSANPGEAFFTGRGLHTFANFDKSHNGRTMPVAEAFRFSVNLVFIRMMRDIVRYYQAADPAQGRDVLADPANPLRGEYLARFADMEGQTFLGQFWKRYGKTTPDQALAALAARTAPVPARLATVFRSVRPEADFAAFKAFMRQHLPDTPLEEDDLASLYAKYGVDRFNLHDRGYIARVHPLELWLVAYLQTRPTSTRGEMMAASAAERQEVYQWLLRSKRKGAADSRIRIILEEDAFEKIHDAWARLGYPFPSLVPSLATAIGSSADRPSALAELIGIILNDGVRQPTVRVTKLEFAEGTPYETRFVRPGGGERLLSSEVAAAVRRGLTDVVANGTAKRLAGTFKDAAGRPLPTGGKTGTGDELADRYGPGTSAGKEKEVSRSAAFAFFIGDRFFGVVTAHVPGPNAKHYHFTSALPVQVLKSLEPALASMMREPPVPAAGPAKVVAEAK